MTNFEQPIATDIIVLGRGLEGDPRQEMSLTYGGMQRVDRALGYVQDNVQEFAERGGTIVFSGGYPGDRTPGYIAPWNREGNLMLARARASDVLDVDAIPNTLFCAETRSRTTLENLVNSRERYFSGKTFTDERPLGIVSHGRRAGSELEGHAWRADYFARKVFRGQLLGERALRHILVTESDDYQPAAPEDVLRQVTQIAFFGLRTPQAMLRREGQLMSLVRRVLVGNIDRFASSGV